MQKVNTWNYTWRVTSVIWASIKKKRKKEEENMKVNLTKWGDWESWGGRGGCGQEKKKGRFLAETCLASSSQQKARFWWKAQKENPTPLLYARFCTTKKTACPVISSGRSVLSEASCHRFQEYWLRSSWCLSGAPLPPRSQSIPRATETERGEKKRTI